MHQRFVETDEEAHLLRLCLGNVVEHAEEDLFYAGKRVVLDEQERERLARGE
jgi:hypothetical protein